MPSLRGSGTTGGQGAADSATGGSAASSAGGKGGSANVKAQDTKGEQL